MTETFCWHRFHCAGWHWYVRSDWRDLLLHKDGQLRLEQWQAERRLQVIKAATHRRVYRVTLPTAVIFIKHYPIADWRSRFRQWGRTSKARREWLIAQVCAEHQLPTIEPLAFGETARRDSFLVTREFPASTLDEFLEAHREDLDRSPTLRARLATQLAALLANLHDAGVEHLDLHPGNVLAAGTLRDLRLALVDLYAARFGPPLNWKRSARNLLLFSLWFWPRTSQADRWRFLRSYLSARHNWPNGRPPRRCDLRDLEASGWDHYLHHWRRRDNRVFRSHRDQRALRAGQNQAWVHRSVSESAAAMWLVSPDTPFAQPDALVLKHSASALVAEVSLPLADGQNRRVIYKRFRRKHWWQRFYDRLRPSPARRSWRNAWRLRDALLPSPKPLLLIETTRFGLPNAAYLAVEKVDGAVDLLSAYRQSTVAMRRRLVRQTARLLRSFHDHGLSHRDLKAANLLAVPKPNGWDLQFIDLVGVQRHRRMQPRRCQRDLSRLAVSFVNSASAADLARFLKFYLGPLGKDRAARRVWWRAIARRVAQKIARNLRRQRPLS